MDLRARAFRASETLQGWIVPDLRYSQSVYEQYLERYAEGVRCWLDVGCGYQLLPPWRFAAEAKLVASVPVLIGVDAARDALGKHRTLRKVICADIDALPFEDDTFDLVTANMVVEHLGAPARQFREIARVLRPGGVFLFHTPNSRSYTAQMARLLPDWAKVKLARILDGRVASDVRPAFHRANTLQAIRQAAGHAGLEVKQVRPTASSPVFGLVPPLALLELLLIRQLMRTEALREFQQTLICVLSKPPRARPHP